MKLTLDRLDLRTEFERTNCSQISFEHFKFEVQEAIRHVGQATFVEFDGKSYNAIHTPKIEHPKLEFEPKYSLVWWDVHDTKIRRTRFLAPELNPENVFVIAQEQEDKTWIWYVVNGNGDGKDEDWNDVMVSVSNSDALRKYQASHGQ